MEIHCKQGQVQLEKPGDFKAFKIVVESDPRDLELVRKVFGPLASFSDAQSAWVSPHLLRAWPSVKDDAAWEQGFDTMIQKATPHGWIDPQTGAIKAHVEWVGPTR